MGTECKLEWMENDQLRCTVCNRIVTPGVPKSEGKPPSYYHYVCGRAARPITRPTHALPNPKEQKELAEGAEALGLRLQDVLHWSKAILKWNNSGRPVRTQEEVDRIVTICQSNQCGKYLSEWGGRCRKCGCRIHQGTIALTNKAKMATEHCPLNEKDKPINYPLW